MIFRFVLVMILLKSGSALGLSVEQLYQRAKENTGKVQGAKLQVGQSNLLKDQAYSTVFPKLSLKASNLWRQSVDAGAFGEESQTNAYLNLTQNIFQGGSEYNQLSIAKIQPKLARQSLRLAESKLYNEIAQRFYSVLEVERELETLKSQENALISRLKRLSQRAKIGRNRVTDVLSAQSQLARIGADVARLMIDLRNQKTQLSILSGVPINQLNRLEDKLVVGSVSDFPAVDEAVENHPEVLTQKLGIEVAREELKSVRGEFLPIVDLSGNYYLSRSGILADSQWDVTISASWNLFDGQYDRGEMKIRDLELKRQELTFLDLKRDIKGKYEALISEYRDQLQVTEKLEDAVKVAKRSYNQHVRDGEKGLVSELEVLRALDDQLQIQRAYDRQIYQSKKTWVEIQSILGGPR